ncbi:ribonuclease HIII [Mycoplasma sp. ATU-Cv-703]|uniref:ribonuclease HIII n=1 Tax=Mycoplasma sp. ATU-Cv-703 TaxID=2498595 RepID=UPI000FDE2066
MNQTGQAENIIGSDETGAGDYYAPLVVAAVFVPRANWDYFRSLGVRDSKQISDRQVLKLFELIKKRIKSSVRYLDQNEYNRLNKTYNANELKTLLHFQALLSLAERLEQVDLAIVDDFAKTNGGVNSTTRMRRYVKKLAQAGTFGVFWPTWPLRFETQAEGKYICVAAASIVARAKLIERMQIQNKSYNTLFPLGSSNPKIVSVGRELVLKHGPGVLWKVAKHSFKTTLQILKLVAEHSGRVGYEN